MNIAWSELEKQNIQANKVYSEAPSSSYAVTAGWTGSR